MSGTFGYELDLGKLSDEECAQVKEQIQTFKELYDVIQNGRYYRLSDPALQPRYTAWQSVTDTEALVSVVVTHTEGNARPLHLCLRGLEADALYRVESLKIYGTTVTPENGAARGDRTAGAVYSGSTLMYAGYTLPQLIGDYPSVQLHLVRV